MNDIVIPGDNPILSPVVDLAIHSGTMKSRLISFVDFMGENPWWKPDFAGYVEHLRQRGNAETTISSHLSTVRERYRQLVLDRDLLYSIVDRHGYRGLAMRKLLVDEIEKRILNECDRKIKLDIT
ncbi:MAG: hypothetical protein J0M07_07035, partial [Anaerolineae bacterium]|nr:hypothetical protein [Anaerolineae bacterium]